MFAVAGEAYRAIRTGILLSRSEKPPQTILFTSGTAGEGKSLTAINTAIVFAQMRDRVLLIDADLRRPRCHEILGCDAHPGLTETLTGLQDLEDVIQPTGVKGLFLLSAGLTPPNPSELLASKKMREVLSILASSYEHILIDSAPILPVSDSVVLSTLVDGVIVVANAQTPKMLVREGCARLLHIGAKIFGIVLNDVDPQQRTTYAPYHHLYR
jgi:capsular exopolysaccharide synthesis family protein